MSESDQHDQAASAASISAVAVSAVTIDADGTAHIPAFAVPMSRYMSDAAKHCLLEQIRNPPLWALEPDIVKNRAAWDRHFYAPRLQQAEALYSAAVEETEIAGIRVDIVTPRAGIEPANERRVLLNLHGGAFAIGAGMGGLIESIPVAVLGGIKVISIHYRQGPEHCFPAASEDIAAVYNELLREYAPEAIGIYGCSAGGLLVAMVAAWFQHHDLPRPGALGIFCSSADDQFDGDSRYTTPPLTGQPAPAPHQHDLGMMVGYLRGADSRDPLVSPLVSPALIAKFPPTLFITGTRSGELSATVHSHAEFTRVGVDARLHIWEGMWHGFFYDAALPEARDAHAVIARFFSRELA